VRITVAIM